MPMKFTGYPAGFGCRVLDANTQHVALGNGVRRVRATEPPLTGVPEKWRQAPEGHGGAGDPWQK